MHSWFEVCDRRLRRVMGKAMAALFMRQARKTLQELASCRKQTKNIEGQRNEGEKADTQKSLSVQTACKAAARAKGNLLGWRKARSTSHRQPINRRAQPHPSLPLSPLLALSLSSSLSLSPSVSACLPFVSRPLSISHPQLKRNEFMYVPFGFMGCRVNHTSLSPNLKHPFTQAASR